MQYTLLIYDDEQLWAGMSERERAAIMQEYFAFTTSLREQGAYVDGAPLQPTATATTVRVRNREQLVTDGPFAETKEQLGGFYLIDAADLNDAIRVAAKLPPARLGCIEIRPIKDLAPPPRGRE